MPLQHQRLHHAVAKRAPAPALITSNGVVVSVVYVTAQPTFSGVIGGYTTVTDDGSNTTQDSDSATSTIRHTVAPNSVISASSSQTRSVALQSHSEAISSSSVPAATTSSAIQINISSSSASGYYATATASAAQPTSSSAASTSSSDGMSMGAKLGLAVGIICAIGIIAILPLIILGKKKRQRKLQEQAESEKREHMNKPSAPPPVRAPSPKAPKLSLRPVSSLVPEFMNIRPKNRNSQGNMLTPISEMSKGSRSASPAIALQDRPRTGDNPFRDPENPFADPEKAAANAPIVIERKPVSPASYTAPAATVSELQSNQRISGPTAESFPLPQTQTQPALSSPAVTNPYTAPATAAMPEVGPVELPGAPPPVVAQGPGGDAPQGSVYRILMDFRPTMEDELELRAGQLVRLLHEYDDGWALCIRLDRSQQGVVPRTCLAAKPSKPRPGPPPMGPASRPMTPQGRPRGPPGPQPGFGSPRAQGPGPVRAQSPAQGRSQSPATITPTTGAYNQSPRPLSPGPRPQKRSESPGPYGASGPKPMVESEQRRRSNSVGSSSSRGKPHSPPGPSKLGPGSPPRSDSPGLAI